MWKPNHSDPSLDSETPALPSSTVKKSGTGEALRTASLRSRLTKRLKKGQTVLTHAAKLQGLREDYVSTAKKPEEHQSVCLTPQTSKL